jgi:dynein heavy chain 1
MIDIHSIVQHEGHALHPFLLISKARYDASSKIDDLALRMGMTSANNSYTSLALGSSEGYEHAIQAVMNAAKRGTWVLLKSVHLSPAWLQSFEKRFYRLQAHQILRLFLSMELNTQSDKEVIPTTLAKQCVILLYEQSHARV